MKKLNKYDFKVIDEFDCDVTKTVSVKRVNKGKQKNDGRKMFRL